MAKCPNCNVPIQADVAECPACKASFYAPGGWCPLPDSVEEEQQIRDKAAQLGNENRAQVAEFHVNEAERMRAVERAHYIPARITLACFSYGLVFFISIIELPLPEGLPIYKAYLFHMFANNWLPAIAIYLLFRLKGAHAQLRSCAKINRMFNVAGGLMVFYLLARVSATTDDYVGPGGFAAFLGVTSVMFVALLMLAGTIWLLVRTLKLGEDRASTPPPAFDLQEKQCVAIALAVPIALAVTLMF